MLRKTIYLVVPLLLIGSLLTAQQKNREIVVYECPQFTSALQVSGLTVYKDTFYLLEEKCKELIVVDRNSLQVIGRKNLKIGKLDNAKYTTELEAIAVYKDHFFITDERNGVIYDYIPGRHSLKTILVDYKLLKADTGVFGMEGIAVNEQKGICYLLKERNGEHASEIRQFAIREQKGVTRFEFLANTLIKHPKEAAPFDNWRYADICFDSGSKKIYCLKSFSLGNNQGKFIIDTIRVNTGTGLIEQKEYTIDRNILYDDITSTIVSLSNKYNTNMEGIIICRNKIYLVSDNYKGNPLNCTVDGQLKTMLMSLSFK